MKNFLFIRLEEGLFHNLRYIQKNSENERDLINYEEIKILKEHKYWVSSIIQVKNYEKNINYLVSGSGDAAIRFYDINKDYILIQTISRVLCCQQGTLVNYDNNRFLVGGGRGIFFYVVNFIGFQVEAKIYGGNEEINTILVLKNNKLIHNGGFLVGGYIWDSNESHLLKLTPDGELEWSRIYDVTPTWIRELEDGFMLANSTYFAGEGAHGKTDIWLARTDEVGNILWSHFYGGSSFDAPSAIFPNTNGGFTVFGYTYSIDGDVQSNSDGSGSESDLWIFHVDGT